MTVLNENMMLASKELMKLSAEFEEPSLTDEQVLFMINEMSAIISTIEFARKRLRILKQMNR